MILVIISRKTLEHQRGDDKMGKIASNRKGSCQVCNAQWDLGNMINLGKRPDGSWAICNNDDCFSKQVSGEAVPTKKSAPPTETSPSPSGNATLNKFTETGSENKTYAKNTAEVKAFHDSIGKFAWEKITELFEKNGQSGRFEQRIISWEGLLKVYATVWSGKTVDK